MFLKGPRGNSARLLLALGISGAAARYVPEVVFSQDTFGTRGGVASEATECSAIGRDILATGVSPLSSMESPR